MRQRVSRFSLTYSKTEKAIRPPKEVNVEAKATC